MRMDSQPLSWGDLYLRGGGGMVGDGTVMTRKNDSFHSYGLDREVATHGKPTKCYTHK